MADVLLVRMAPPEPFMDRSEIFARAESAKETLALLKLLRFRLLLASMDVPDMRPWELFERARRTQARLQCALVDDRLSMEDEQRIRQVGGAVFGLNDPGLLEAIAKFLPATSRWKPVGAREPARAPP
jgi:hypothetical protein